jgi:hypothetical protein
MEDYTIYGTVNHFQYNYYYFDIPDSTTGAKLIVETYDDPAATAVYISTTTQQPTITSNSWDSIGEYPNTVVILPSDPNFVVGRYYVGIEGWYGEFGAAIDYNATLFLSN